jgi:hypothetical protein
MRKYFLIIISYITKMMMIHPKKFKKMLVNQQVAKTPQAIFMEIRFMGSSSQAYMMAYDKQTIKRLYNDGRLGNNPLGGMYKRCNRGYFLYRIASKGNFLSL